MPPVQVVLLDVYGTLLRGQRFDRPETAMRRVAAEFGLRVTVPSLVDAFQHAIVRAHANSPEPWPEVEVRDLWREIFPELTAVDALAKAMERAQHRVEPVDGAAEFIAAATRAKLPLGIVSNAQAYTRSWLDEYFGHGQFDLNRSAFSYLHRIAKPDRRLFEVALAIDDQRGIPRGEILMIGDSDGNDIAPAVSLGLRTHRVPRGGPFPAFAELMAQLDAMSAGRKFHFN